MNWNDLIREVAILILQCCNWSELLLFISANRYWYDLIQEESRVWKNCVLERTDIACHKEFHEYDESLSMRKLLHVCPLMSNVGNMRWMMPEPMDYFKSLLELRDLVQLFPHLHQFCLVQTSYTYTIHFLWDQLFCPRTNNFRHTLIKLRLIDCDLTPENIALLTPDHFPQLRNLYLYLPHWVKFEPALMLALSKLVQLTHLQLEHRSYKATRENTAVESYSPIVLHLKQLQFFGSTTCHMIPEVIQLFYRHLPSCCLWFTLEYGTDPDQSFTCISKHDIQLLKLAQQLHLDQFKICVAVSIKNYFIFDTLLQYAATFRETILVYSSSEPELWLLNNIQRWQTMSQCQKLRTIDIRCKQRMEFNLECIYLLRRIYKQLQVFRLEHIMITESNLLLLKAEIKQMTNLQHSNNTLIDVKIIY